MLSLLGKEGSWRAGTWELEERKKEEEGRDG